MVKHYKESDVLYLRCEGCGELVDVSEVDDSGGHTGTITGWSLWGEPHPVPVHCGPISDIDGNRIVTGVDIKPEND